MLCSLDSNGPNPLPLAFLSVEVLFVFVLFAHSTCSYLLVCFFSSLFFSRPDTCQPSQGEYFPWSVPDHVICIVTVRHLCPQKTLHSPLLVFPRSSHFSFLFYVMHPI